MHKTSFHPSYGAVAYQVEGPENVPPVVLIHGFAEDANIWNIQTDALKTRYRLIIPDLPGCGMSAALTKSISIEAAAEVIKSVLDAENIKTCTMIGHSMGGYITLAFMDNYPQYIAAAGLFHSTANPDTDEKKTSRRRSIGFIQEYGAAAFIRQTTPNLFAEENRRNRPGLIDEIVDRYTNFAAASLIAYYEAMIDRPDRKHALESFTRPFLFILGQHDNAVPIATVLPQTYLPSLSYIHILEQAGHMGMMEEPALSNQFLLTFLQNIQIYHD